MNDQLYRAAMRAGCSRSEAEVIAAYVESETLRSAARELRIAPRTALRRLASARRRMKVAHTSALVAVLMIELRGAPKDVTLRP